MKKILTMLIIMLLIVGYGCAQENNKKNLDEVINQAFSNISLPSETSSNLSFVQEMTIDEYTLQLKWKTSSDVISATGEVNPTTEDEVVDIIVTITLEDKEQTKKVGSVLVRGVIEETKVEDVELLSLNIDEKIACFKGTAYGKLSDDVQVENTDGEKLELEELMVGIENITLVISEELITKIIIPSDFMFTKIRVAIRYSINDIANVSTLYHSSISLSLTKATTIRTYDNSEVQQLNSGTVIISIENNQIKVVNGSNIYYFDKRIQIDEQDTEIKIDSISRGGDLKYAGVFDINIVNNRLLLVTEVDLEDYLLKVVPSEMPSSWNIEALKAQAVAARTYAYSEFYNRKYLDLGYVVDDSTQSQVYNNIGLRDSTTRAVLETKGVVLFYENMPIIAFYYSTGCGLVGSGNEVWIEDKVTEDYPYLQGIVLAKKLNGETYEIDPTSEESMLEFFKQIQMISPGGSSPYHRWKVTMTKEQLRETINHNISNMVEQYPKSFLQLDSGEWVQKDFPNDIGKIDRIYVSERGSSGVVVSLTIEAENVTFKIINQYNIRFTIRPRDVSSTVPVEYAYSSDTTYSEQGRNISILSSGYFALEIIDDTVYFYGGGNGHGVGMDQYGARYYAANEGYTYDQILKIYFPNVDLVTIS